MSIAQKIDEAFEKLRELLVSLVGDVPGVHNTVNDAKMALAPHVLEEPADPAKLDPEDTEEQGA